MKKIISFISGSGGSGKTTAIATLADGLAIRGEKVLVVDLCLNMNLSIVYGDLHISECSIYDVIFSKECNIYDVIQPVNKKYFRDLNVLGKVDILPANVYIQKLQQKLTKMSDEKNVLLKTLQQLDGDDYDYIFIDTDHFTLCDPLLNNVLYASDEVIISTKLDAFSSIGVELVYPAIEHFVEEQLNPELKINGILFTEVDEDINYNVYNDLVDYAQKKGIYVYESYLRRLKEVPNSQHHRKSIFVNKGSDIVENFNSFINEFCGKEKALKNKDKTFALRLEETDLSILKKIANEKGHSVNHVICEAIKYFIIKN